MKRSKFINKRKHIRFKPEKYLGQVDFQSKPSAAFKPNDYVLVVSESYGGCGIIGLKHKKMVAGNKIKIQVGELAPLVAEVMWTHEIDTEVIRVGLKYQETK